jgi:hypothetical protein
MFQPQVLTQEEIRSLLNDLTGEEVEQARALSLTPLKREILYEGVPGGAIVRDVTGREYIDCTAQAWTLNVGYCHPDVLAAVAEQMRHLTHVRYGFPTIPRIKLINRLAGALPRQPEAGSVEQPGRRHRHRGGHETGHGQPSRRDDLPGGLPGATTGPPWRPSPPATTCRA